MTQTDWDNMYRNVYAAYWDAGIFDEEYIRSTLGQVLDHMIAIQNHRVHPLIQSK